MFDKKAVLCLILLPILILAACQPSGALDEPGKLPDENPTGSYPVDEDEDNHIYGQDAVVESLEVVLLESFPLQAQAKVTGYFPNGCIELHEILVEKQEAIFSMTITTKRPSGDIGCTEALVPFEQDIMLDIEGLQAGTYTVIAQDQETTFELAVDNTLADQDKDWKFEFGSNAVVESMTLNIMESFPIQVSVSLSGYLPNGCVKMEQINVLRDKQTFFVKIITKQPAGDVSCTMAIVPFEETIALDVEGLPAGEYFVQCSEMSESFILDQNNTAP